jgi:plastocyanin
MAQMMTKGLLIAFTTVLVMTFAAFAISAGVMMGRGMMGTGNAGMMGGMMGGGSNPAKQAAVAGVTQVRMENFAFTPANIVIDAGTTVTWTNYDSVAHTVTSDGGGVLGSPLLGKNKTFSHTFDKPGEYRYHCTPHPNMQGLVTVRPAASN